jgi:hypothetical protein
MVAAEVDARFLAEARYCESGAGCLPRERSLDCDDHGIALALWA